MRRRKASYQHFVRNEGALSHFAANLMISTVTKMEINTCSNIFYNL